MNKPIVIIENELTMIPFIINNGMINKYNNLLNLVSSKDLISVE